MFRSSKPFRTTLFLAALAFAPLPANADSIGINFMGGEGNYNPNGGILAPSDVAGAHGGSNPDLRQANWNNVLPDNAVNGSYSALADNHGVATAAAINVSGVSGLWSLPIPNTTADQRLMRGYLDPVLTIARVEVSGIPYAQYDVVVYGDGSNDNNLRIGRYEIGGLPPVYMFDNNVNFDGTFTQVPSSSNANLGHNTPAGNFTIFSGLSSPSFVLTATPDATDGFEPRAPLNAVQIIKTPEPPTAVLALVAIAIGCLQRRRTRLP